MKIGEIGKQLRLHNSYCFHIRTISNKIVSKRPNYTISRSHKTSSFCLSGKTTENNLTHLLHLFQTQIVINWQSKNILGNTTGNLQRILNRNLFVARKITDEGIEITAGKDVVLFETSVEFITRHTKLLLVHLDGHISIVISDIIAGLWLESKAVHTPEQSSHPIRSKVATHSGAK